MTKIKLSEEMRRARPILNKLVDAGYQAYFVGGCVRDSILNRPIHDVDVCTDAFPEEIKQVFDNTVDTGIDHGVVVVHYADTECEITTFRADSKYEDFRRPEKVTFVRSLAEDLKRRDFTMNALAADVNGNVIDYFKAIPSLNKRVLKTVGDANIRFNEDALRMLRAVRFQSQLNMTLDSSLFDAIQENASLITHVSIERVASEFTKMMMSFNRNKGLLTFINTGLYKYVPLFADKHDELMALTKLPEDRIYASELLWTIVCSQLSLSVDETMKAWKQTNSTTKIVKAATRLLSKGRDPLAGDFFNVDAHAVSTAIQACRIVNSHHEGVLMASVYHNMPIRNMRELAISGEDLINLGVAEGPTIGNMLLSLANEVRMGNVHNRKQALLDYAKTSIAV